MKKGILFLLLIPSILFGQTIGNTRIGASIGVLLNFGSHVNSIGLSLNSYYQDYFYQLNVGSSLTYNLNAYGNRSKFWESRTNVGTILLGGKKQLSPDFQLNGLFHNSNYNYGIGFNYVWYYDNVGTSQLSGGWSVHLKNTAVLIENDVFGGQAKDRFRSGHVAVSYRKDDLKFSSGLYIWTGETANSIWIKVKSKNCPSGFRILEDLPYGKTSLGILYGGISYNLGYGQFLQSRIGLDSERIRHFFQNRLAHDLKFLPSSIERNTPHYPRLDSNGCPVFDNESIRKNKLYFQLGSNENWSN